MKPETLQQLQARCTAHMHLHVCNGCTACALRCTAGVPATHDEWQAICNHISGAPEHQKQTIREVLTQDKTLPLGDDVAVQMCPFWDTRTHHCAIYPVRPLVCRLLGHVEWMPCPIEKVPHTIPTPLALRLMRTYARQQRNTFAAWEQETGTRLLTLLQPTPAPHATEQESGNRLDK